MANVAAPFGFLQMRSAGGPVNFAEDHNPPYRIAGGASPYATAIYFGDAVRMNASLTGYVERWTAADGSGSAANILLGIFVGCSYYSSSQAKFIESRYWPGSTDAVGDVSAYVVGDPSSLWKVQAGGAAAITQAQIGQTVDISATPVGNTSTGSSGMSLATPTNTPTTLPFKVVNVITDPPGTNGTDLTTPFNYVVVAFNNQMLKSLVGV